MQTNSGKDDSYEPVWHFPKDLVPVKSGFYLGKIRVVSVVYYERINNRWFHCSPFGSSLTKPRQWAYIKGLKYNEQTKS